MASRRLPTVKYCKGAYRAGPNRARERASYEGSRRAGADTGDPRRFGVPANREGLPGAGKFQKYPVARPPVAAGLARGSRVVGGWVGNRTNLRARLVVVSRTNSSYVLTHLRSSSTAGT